MSSPASPSFHSNKSESFFEYLGTLGRRKKIKKTKELQELQEEAKAAIDGSVNGHLNDTLPEQYILDEYEERSMIDPSMSKNKDFQDLVKLLINWINDELSDQRIIVRNLEENLYDGQIFGKLVEKLSGKKLDIVEVTLNEDLQKNNLLVVLSEVNKLLHLDPRKDSVTWKLEEIHNKNLVHIIHLLVALIKHFRPPIKLPENVFISLIIVQKVKGKLVARKVKEQLTGSCGDLGMRVEPRDAFDTLFDHAPDHLHIVKKSLLNFVNRQLYKLNIECPAGSNCEDFDPKQFSDGLFLIFLMGMVEGYFVPLGNIFTTINDAVEDNSGNLETCLSPHNYINTSSIHKLHNVNVALQLMEDAGIPIRQKVRAEDIVNGDLKSILRLLYMIFSKYKHL